MRVDESSFVKIAGGRANVMLWLCCVENDWRPVYWKGGNEEVSERGREMSLGMYWV